MLMMALCGVITTTSAQRSIWKRRRSQAWWDQDAAGYTEQEFFQNFRKWRNTVHHIGQRLSPRLSRGDRRSISLRKRVGLWPTGLASQSPPFALLCTTSAKLCTRSSCLTILGGVSPSVLGRSTGGKCSSWQFRLRSHSKRIRYVSDSGPHLKVA